MNTVKVVLRGKEYTLKFGALSLVRKARVENIDLSILEDPNLGIDQIYAFILRFALPKEDHFWKNEDELIDALDENSPQTLKALVDGFNHFLGFIQTLNESVSEGDQGKGAKRKK